jgi:hypothetical protein
VEEAGGLGPQSRHIDRQVCDITCILNDNITIFTYATHLRANKGIRRKGGGGRGHSFLDERGVAHPPSILTHFELWVGGGKLEASALNRAILIDKFAILRVF